MTIDGSSRTTGKHHGDLRQALMAAALAMVATGDEKSLSLREVARRAGVSPAAPYHHFADKESLLAAVACEGFERLGQALREAAKLSRSPQTKLSRMAAEYVRFALAHHVHYRIMVSPSLGNAAAHPALHNASLNAFSSLAEAVASVGGKIPPAEVKRRAAFAWALAHGIVELKLNGALTPLTEDDAEVLAKHVGSEVLRLAKGD
jgi:AcrR family transcriptional regulator